MIIKKPYAFLIRHFRIIHFLLVIPMVYLIFAFGDISSFLQEYAETMSTNKTNLAGNFITLYMYLAIIVLLVVNIVILTLMKSKKKSYTLYSSTSIYYTILLGLTLLFYIVFQGIDKGNPSDTMVSLAGSIAYITTLPGYLLVPAVILQALGFNIKTMKFDRSLDLQISDDDSEEVELKLLRGNGEAKRNLVHYFRELQYYVLENKGIFILVSVILGLVVIISIYLHFGVYNKRYNIYQAFALDSFTMTVKESYLTQVDYSGQKLANDKYYLAIKIAIHNKTFEAQSIKKSNFRIYYGDESIFPNYDRSSRFIDVGKNYQGGLIQPDTTDDFVLVYELDSTMVKNKYQMRILSSLKKEPGKLIPSYKIINIRPTNIIDTEYIADVKVGETKELTDTNLFNTKYTLRKINYNTNFLYDYKQCSEFAECTNRKNNIIPKSGKVLLIIKDSIEWDKTTSYYKNSTRDFYADFATVEYDYTNSSGKTKTYVSQMVNVTPTTINNYKVYEVNSLVAQSSNVKIHIRIRNKNFYIDVGKLSKLTT